MFEFQVGNFPLWSIWLKRTTQQNTESEVSKAYVNALRNVVDNGVGSVVQLQTRMLIHRISRRRWFMWHRSTIKLSPYIRACLLRPPIHLYFVPSTLTVMPISASQVISVTRTNSYFSSSSDFLSNLLVLLLRVLNSGLPDSGLIAHLSEATAGSLNGVGHSTAYEEISTYSYAPLTTHRPFLTLILYRRSLAVVRSLITCRLLRFAHIS